MSLEQQVQADLLSASENHLAYIQLCNAFYAREVVRLSTEKDAARLRKLLHSLPYYIARASEHILAGNNPLQLDGSNGCWIAKQKLNKPIVNFDHNQTFYRKRAFTGLILPLGVSSERQLMIKIDCLDQVLADKIHCNEHGWFNYQGEPLEQQSVTLLKPTKTTMTAACCGHQWMQDKRVSPRLLSLREMLLAARINWLNFAKPLV